jgi:hypothetical protein
VRAFPRGRLEERVALVPAHRPDALQALRGIQLVRPRRLPAAELEGRVDGDDAVVDRV